MRLSDLEFICKDEICRNYEKSFIHFHDEKGNPIYLLESKYSDGRPNLKFVFKHYFANVLISTENFNIHFLDKFNIEKLLKIKEVLDEHS